MPTERATIQNAARACNSTENAHLTVPSISKEEEVKAIEDDIEGEATRLQELALEPVFAHCAEGLCAVPERIRYQTSVVRPARQRSETQRKGGRDEGLRRTEGGKKRAWAWASPGKEGCIGWHGDGHL